jgi:hypothetical protein
MAQLTGVLGADFSAFTRAVDSAQVQLKGFEGNAGKVENSLERMANSLSGNKLIQDATLMAEAVELIGGASKLTDAELAKLGRTATEAVEKMKRLGMDVPDGLQKIADGAKKVETATKSAEQSTFDWKSALLSTAGAFGLVFSVDTLKNYVVGVIQTGAAIGDLSVKLGVSAEAVQRWQYAAEQSGATIETVDKAVKAMNVNLAEGNKSTKAALEAVGLSFAEIRQMRPEDAFEAIGDAVGKIEDPMLRAQVATELFGKAGQELLPTFVDGIKKVGSETKVMSDETIKSLKAAEDAWGRLANSVTIASGGVIAKMLQTADTVSIVWKAMMNPSNTEAVEAMKAHLLGVAGSLDQATEAAPKLLNQLRPLSQVGLKPVALDAAEVTAVIKTMTTSLGLSTAQLAKMEPQLGTLEQATRNMNRVWNETAPAVDAANEKLRFTSEVIGELPAKIEAASTALESSFLGPKGGGGAIDTSGMTITDNDELWRQYNATHMGSQVGGGEDVLSYGLRAGLIHRPGSGYNAPSISNVFNIVDTESEIARRVSDTISSQLQRGSLVN